MLTERHKEIAGRIWKIAKVDLHPDRISNLEMSYRSAQVTSSVTG